MTFCLSQRVKTSRWFLCVVKFTTAEQARCHVSSWGDEGDTEGFVRCAVWLMSLSKEARHSDVELGDGLIDANRELQHKCYIIFLFFIKTFIFFFNEFKFFQIWIIFYVCIKIIYQRIMCYIYIYIYIYSFIIKNVGS